MHTHILLEVYCELSFKDEICTDDVPEFCGMHEVPTYECIFNRCPYVSVTSCENTLCYTGTDSEAEGLISFGGEMGNTDSELNEWKNICIEKINEAYVQYMQKRDQIKDTDHV